MRKIASLTFLGAVLGFLTAAPAQAQATRTWVSGVGDDANPCSRTAPCKTFEGAISKTAAGGEINALDPGGFGSVVITKSITISSTFEGGVLVSGTNGIVVNVAASDVVVLEGLDIEGLGTGLNGVNIIGGGRTTIRKCSIRNFLGLGPSSAAVNLQGTNARVYITDSVLLHNGLGVNVLTQAGSSNFAMVQNTIVDLNTAAATQVVGASTLVLSGTTLAGSPFSIANLAGNGGSGTVISYGNNIIRNAGAPTQTLVLQ